MTCDFLPFTLSILLTGQPVMFYIKALGWRFYNSKSFIPNGLTSPFEKNTSRFLSSILCDSTRISSFICHDGSRDLFSPKPWPQSLFSYSWQGSQIYYGSPRFLESTQPRLMRPLPSFWNKIKPYGVIPNSKFVWNSNANRLELAFLGKNRKDSRAYVISSLNKTFVNSGTKLCRVSGTSNII